MESCLAISDIAAAHTDSYPGALPLILLRPSADGARCGRRGLGRKPWGRRAQGAVDAPKAGEDGRRWLGVDYCRRDAGRRDAGPLPQGGSSAWAPRHYSCPSTPMRAGRRCALRREATKALVPAVVAHCKRDRPAMCASVLTGASPPMRACVSGPC